MGQKAFCPKSKCIDGLLLICCIVRATTQPGAATSILRSTPRGLTEAHPKPSIEQQNVRSEFGHQLPHFQTMSGLAHSSIIVAQGRLQNRLQKGAIWKLGGGFTRRAAPESPLRPALRGPAVPTCRNSYGLRSASHGVEGKGICGDFTVQLSGGSDRLVNNRTYNQLPSCNPNVILAERLPMYNDDAVSLTLRYWSI
jgi:hypothetical protein